MTADQLLRLVPKAHQKLAAVTVFFRNLHAITRDFFTNDQEEQFIMHTYLHSFCHESWIKAKKDGDLKKS